MASNEIVQLLKVESRRGFLGLGSVQVTAPTPVAGTQDFFLRSVSGLQKIQPFVPGSETLDSDANVKFVRVRTSTQPLVMGFAALLEDPNAHKWDFVLKGFWCVYDCQKFLHAFGLSATSPGACLTSQLVESWLANSLGSHVRDAVKGQSAHDLLQDDVLPTRWWETHINEWLDHTGIKVKIERKDWQSAEATAWQAEQARQQDLARIEQERERQRQAELREVAARTNYEKEKARLEADRALSEKERANQLQALELRHRAEIVRLETEIENAKREAEAAALRHEVTLAQLRDDKEAIARAKVKEQELSQQHRELTEKLAGMQRVLEKLATLPENLLARLADLDANRAHDARERVTQLSGVTALQLADLGFSVSPQVIVQNFREKAFADRDAVVLRMAELRTRDIGPRKVKALPINSSLQFEFSTQRTGYVTLVNIGTSGSVYLHVPSVYIGPAEAKVVAGNSYMIPGRELLPWNRLRQDGLDYVEVGPPGWEHIGIIVSDEAIVAAEMLARSTSDSPFVKLTSKELDELCRLLSERPMGTWSAGVLSFLVG